MQHAFEDMARCMEMATAVTKAVYAQQMHMALSLAVLPFELASYMLTSRAERAIDYVEVSPFGGHQVFHVDLSRH